MSSKWIKQLSMHTHYTHTPNVHKWTEAVAAKTTNATEKNGKRTKH